MADIPLRLPRLSAGRRHYAALLAPNRPLPALRGITPYAAQTMVVRRPRHRSGPGSTRTRPRAEPASDVLAPFGSRR
jgi:hypothetical protein